jgi:hypothetical protein
VEPPADNVPSPPTTARAAAPLTPQARLVAGLCLAGALGVLGIAAWLRPDPRGYGTHEQLKPGPCGMLIVTGYPCPTCGMTTAFACTVRGRWLRALWVQPAGFVLALATAVLAVVSGWTLVAGRWPVVQLRFVTPFRLYWTLLILLLAGWGFKIVTGLLDKTLPYVH